MILIVVALGVALLGGGAVLVLALRTPARPYASCGQCGYDVGASLGNVDRCPECGARFAEVGVLPPTPRRRRTAIVGVILVGVLLLGTLAGTSLMLSIRANGQAVQARAAAAQQRQIAVLSRQAALLQAMTANQAPADAIALLRERLVVETDPEIVTLIDNMIATLERETAAPGR